MKKALIVVLSAYALMLLLFALASRLLPVLRYRLLYGLTIGDIVLVAIVVLYGLFIYNMGVRAVRDSCRGRYRNDKVHNGQLEVGDVHKVEKGEGCAGRARVESATSN